MVTLAEAAEISGGITKNAKRSALPIQRPYLSVANVNFNRIDTNNLSNIGVNEAEIARAQLMPGDLMVVEGNGSLSQLGRVAVWQGQVQGCLHQNHLIKVRPKPIAKSKWLLYWLMSSAGRRAIEATASSTSGLHTLSLAKVGSLPTPIASLEEQEIAIAYIELHLSRLDETVATLQGIQAKLKQARASILKAAVEGRLVETEAELAIRQGRTHELAAELLDTMDRQKNKKSAITSETAAPQWDAPTSWEWTNIGHVSLKVKYGTSAKCQERGDGIPVIRMGNIQDGKIHMDKIKYLPKTHHEFPEQLLRKGEVLFNRTNSIDLVGKTAVFRGDSPHACASYIIRVLPADGISPEFLAITLNSPFGRAWARHEASQQVGQANINSKKLMNFRFPLPPRLEQLRIKEEVDRRFSVLDQVEATVQTSLARCGKLRQAILKRAFRG